MISGYRYPDETDYADGPAHREDFHIIAAGSCENVVIIPKRKVYPRLDKISYSFNQANRKQQVSIPVFKPRYLFQRNNLSNSKK